MLNFIQTNLATIITLLAVAAIVLLVILKMAADKRKGKSSCTMGCGGCPNSGLCHPSREP